MPLYVLLNLVLQVIDITSSLSCKHISSKDVKKHITVIYLYHPQNIEYPFLWKIQHGFILKSVINLSVACCIIMKYTSVNVKWYISTEITWKLSCQTEGLKARKHCGQQMQVRGVSPIPFNSNLSYRQWLAMRWRSTIYCPVSLLDTVLFSIFTTCMLSVWDPLDFHPGGEGSSLVRNC